MSTSEVLSFTKIYATGSNRTMDILNREDVLEVESLSNQNIAARLEMYNGDLNLPRPI